MTPAFRRRVVLGAALGVSACAERPLVLLPDPPRAAGVEALVAGSPLRPEENIRARPVTHGEHSSVRLVRIRGREEPHVHTRYDLTVVLLEGDGTLWLAGVPLAMRPGDVAFVPKGTPHFFVNEGRGPAAALVSFAPAFDGPDQAPVR